MARIRSIKPEFWDDLKIAKISRDARLLYIGLWNFADDLGVVVGDSIWIKSKIFPFDHIQIQQFERWIQELVKSGFISLFSHKGEKFYYLPTLTRHQVINRPNYEKVNIQKADLKTVLEQSLIVHGTISDESVMNHAVEGKGEEGKGEEIDERQTAAFQNFKKFIEKYCPNVRKIQNQITEQEFLKLRDKYPSAQIREKLQAMENKKGIDKNYTSVYLTLNNWLKRDENGK